MISSAASGPPAYANVQAFTSSFIGRLIVFGYTWALLHHLLSGLRHLVWDLGYGFKANEREAMAWGTLIGGVVLGVAQNIGAQINPQGFFIAGHGIFLIILFTRLFWGHVGATFLVSLRRPA